MCDGCYRLLADDEIMTGVKLVDDYEQVKVFRGHKSCVELIVDDIVQLYGNRENVSLSEENNE